MHKKDHPRNYTKSQTAVNEISIGICIGVAWNVTEITGRKAVLGDVKTTFTCTPL